VLIFVSGPISGVADHNRPAFERARRILEWRWDRAGVFIPHDTFGGRQDLEYETYMDVDRAVLTISDLVAVLPKWEDSPGSSSEVALARDLGKPLYFMKL